MSLKFGNTNIQSVYFGNTHIIKAYHGNNLVFNQSGLVITGSFTAGAGGPTNGVGYIQGGSGSWATLHNWGGPFGTCDNDNVAVIWDIPSDNDTYFVLRGDYSDIHLSGAEFDLTVDNGEDPPSTVHFVPLVGWHAAHVNHSVWYNNNDQLGLVNSETYTFTIEEVV